MMNASANTGWKPLGHVSPQGLSGPRLSLHWAIQVPTAGAITLLPHADDYSHTAMTWDASAGALLTHPAKQHGSLRVGLRIADLEVVVTDEAGAAKARFALVGKTLQEAYDELGRSVSELSGRSVTIQPSDYSVPDHPVKNGGRWSPVEAAALAEFAALYHDADRFLRAYRSREDSAGQAVVWPHHFDMAVLTVFDPNEPDAEKARSVGVGMSPGDETYDEPYVYVLPWPHLAPDALTDLGAVGHWQTQGFVGAVLTASEWLTSKDPAEQEARVMEFVERAVAASKKGLGV